MPLPSSGQISLLDIRNEFGGSAPYQLSDYYNRGSAPSSGQISIGDFYGQGALSAVHLGTLTDTSNMIYSGTVNASSLTTNDGIVICGTAESERGTQVFTVNNSTVTARVVNTPTSNPVQYCGVYIGSISQATSGMAGDSTLTVAQTTNPGNNLSFRAGCAVFRLVNAGIHNVVSSAVSTIENSAQAPRSITRSVTASPEQIIFVAAHCGQGDNSTATLSTNSGTMTRYEGVSEPFGNGEFAVITGATNPTITWATTYSGASQGMAVACTVFGY